jgi:hypothetical protein
MNADLQMYGIADINLYIERSIKPSATYRFSGGYMIVAGLISNAQELIEADFESARQILNIAKYILFEIMEGNLVGNVSQTVD